MFKVKANNNFPLTHSENSDFLKVMMNKGIIGVQNAVAPNITTPNINAPLGALAYIKPKAVDILTAPRTSDKLSILEKNGVWGNKTVQIKVKELEGTTSPDDGSAHNGTNASVNYDVVSRGVYYYRASWNTNDLEEATVGAMNENARADMANAAMEALAIDRNKFFFYGVKEKGLVQPVEGLLNATNLPAYQTVPAGSAETNPTYWVNKTAEGIYNDIVDAVNQLNVQSKGLSEEERSRGGKLVLAVASDSIGQIDRKNTYGKSARAMLKETYGETLELVSVPQFNKADSSSDVFYLEMKPAGKDTIIHSYVEMARAYPLEVHSSEVYQKISAATSGCIVQYPMFVVRFNGIGA